MKSRVKRIFSHLEEKVDVVVISNSTEPHVDLTFLYVTGATSGLFEGCVAVCHRDGGVELVTSALEEGLAAKTGLPLRTFRTREEREEHLKKVLRRHRRIGVNAAELTKKAADEIRKFARGAKLVDVSKAVVEARIVKDEDELANLRRAGAIASAAFVDLLPKIRPGRRETEVAADLVYAMQLRGASDPSFRTIVGSGPNGADPHYTAGTRKLRKGDLVVLDFGARYKAYCSDVTRTVVVGKASPKQRSMYEVVRRAQSESIRRMRPRVTAKSVDRVARDIIDGSEFKGRFIHGLGHGIGLSVHDGGGLNQASDLVLRKNMVFTNEPGVYLRGFGGVRIEDDVLVTGGAPRLLTNAPRDLIEL